MTMFRIRYFDSDINDYIKVEKEFDATLAGVSNTGFKYGAISAYEWAYDWTYMMADKRIDDATITEIK